MKKGLSVCMFSAILLACGSTSMLTSCSDGNVSEPDIVADVTPVKGLDINSSLLSAKTDLESVDFQELLPLVQALNNNTFDFKLNDVAVTRSSGLFQSLTEQLKNFYTQDGGTKAYNKSWQFSKLTDALRQSVDLSLEMESSADSHHVSDTNFTNKFDIRINDTLVYRITDEVLRKTESASWSIENIVNRKQTLEKNGTELAVIETNQVLDASLNSMKLDIGTSITGSLTYMDKVFSLERTRHNSDSYSSTFRYINAGQEVVSIGLSGDNNLSLDNLIKNQVVFRGGMNVYINDGLIGIESNIDNMNKFYTAGVNVASVIRKGTSKENCQKLSNDFNDIVKSKLMLASGASALGDLILEPVVMDSGLELYRPEIMIQSGEDKVPLSSIMDMFGLSFDSIMNMLLNKGE